MAQRPAGMKASSLVILTDSITAQRMATSWPLLRRHPASVTDALVEEWAEVAGIDESDDVWALCVALIRHGICRSDGTIDPLAESYIANYAAGRLRARVTRGKT